MRKLIGCGERVASVEVLMEIIRIVVKETMIYVMEMYWNRQKEMKENCRYG